MRSIANGSERKFHERWLAEAALAWDVAITDKHPDVAVSQLRRAAYELRRIDVEHWLMVELELLRLRDACLHAASPEDICALAELARTYGAGTVLRGVTELREKATHQQAPTELN